MSVDEMYGRVGWMKPVDEAILRLLANPLELILSPGNIAVNVDYNAGYVGERCAILESLGLLEHVGDAPYYQISEYGKAAVNGEISISELDGLAPEDIESPGDLDE